MKSSNSVVEADLSYAVRIVQSRFASVEDAARTCGVDVADLRARLASEPASNEPQRSLPQQKLFESFNR
jgi:hypothetical protein